MFEDRLQKSPLYSFFKPKTVAVIGAKEDAGSVGAALMHNLLNSSFPGTVFPVNPKHKQVLGRPCFPSVKQTPERVDLAIIATPAATVPQLVRECVEANVQSAIIISAGFKEVGPAGLALEKEISEAISHSKMRIIGPNCLGVMNPGYGLNASFASGASLSGNIAFLSQSGAMCTAALDWSLKEKIGFSLFASIGSMIDVDWGDLIDYLAEDPHTQCIILYIESIGSARSFLSAAREIAFSKPIIAIKAGKTEAAARAASSHTGALAGSDAVFAAAMRRVGVMRVNTIAELFDAALFLAKQPMPKGPNLTIVTNAGGPGVITTDATVTAGAKMAQLAEETISELNAFLPKAWSGGNPIDILGDATADRYAKAVEVAARDSHSNGLLVVLTPQEMTDPTLTAERIIPFTHLPEKPIFASWMGGKSVAEGMAKLNLAGIPTFAYPDQAATLFADLCSRNSQLKAYSETPLYHYELDEEKNHFEINPQIRSIFALAAKENRTILTEVESKKVFSLYGIPIVETFLAASSEEAVRLAEQIGYPVVLKVLSTTITHKSDVGGVKLNLQTKEDVEAAFEEIKRLFLEHAKDSFEGVSVQKMIPADGYELILGSSVDGQFGPVILFGSGGKFVEIFKDYSLVLPPLNATVARRTIVQTKMYEILKGARGEAPVDLSKVEEILVRFSQMIVEHPRIKESDINPLYISREAVFALDARIVLHDHALSDDELPKTAIRPYPTTYINRSKLSDQTPITFRPIRSEDEPLLIQFHKELTEKTVFDNYLEPLSFSMRVDHQRLMKFCYSDYDRELILLAETEQKGRKIIAGLARLVRLSDKSQAQLRVVISDHYQSGDLAMQLLQLLLQVAKNEGVAEILSYILPENSLRPLFEQLGFRYQPLTENPAILLATLQLF